MEQLVLCIDRDDDIGRKTGIKGPIIGRQLNLEVAQKLALADPADTDVNAIYSALKIASELDAEIVTLTGKEHVGLISDREIASQLDEVIAKLNPASVIFVSDGMDDEQVMPIVQSRVKINAVHRVVVRQSKELEKAYFKFTNFMKEVTGDPTLARLLFGLPGLVLLLLAIGGVQAFNLIIGVMGVYLIIKGFGWEEEFFTQTGEFLKSLSVERISTILYFMALIIFALGVGYAYSDLQRSVLTFTDSSSTLNTLWLFILNSSSLNLVMLAIGIVILARIMDEWSIKRFIHVRRYLILLALIGLIKFVLDAGASYMISEESGFINFILQGIAGVFVLGLWIKVTGLFFKTEIKAIDRILRDTEGKQVVDTDGAKRGKVAKAVVENLQLKEIRVGSKTIPRADIISIGADAIIIKKEEAAVIPPAKPASHFRFPAPQSFPKLPDFTYPRKKKKQA